MVLWSHADAAASESKRAEITLQCLWRGSLVLANRLHSSGVELPRILEQSECFRVFSRTKALPVKELQLLKTAKIPADLLEDWLVGAGFAADPMKLRRIRLTRGTTTCESLPNVLAASRSSAGEVAEPYLLH